MSQLIPFEKRAVGTDLVDTVNARDLYIFLEVKQRFNEWITKRISQYGFSETIDFTRYCVYSSDNPNPPIDYFLTFDMAKQLSMVERNAKGREARLYFIACEKTLKELPITQGSMLVRLAMAYEQQEQKLLAIEAEQSAQKDAMIFNQQETIKAQDMALMALRGQLWMTIRHYVYMHELQPQMPERPHQIEYGRWLSQLCREQNIPLDKVVPADRKWESEIAYPVQMIHETLEGWLKRRIEEPLGLN